MNDTAAFGVAWLALTGGLLLVVMSLAGVVETRRLETDRTTRRVMCGILSGLMFVGAYIAHDALRGWIA